MEAVDFGTAFLLITVLAVVAAVATLFVGGDRPYESIGRGELTFDRPKPDPPPGSAAARAESEAEIRQLLEAKSMRRERRGEAPLDIEAELAALTRPPPADHDPALREEVRQVVVARNERRLARGQEPLDVEAEVDRQLRELGG
jgi:hypothetical protein